MIADSFMEHHMAQLMVYNLAARKTPASPRVTKATWPRSPGPSSAVGWPTAGCRSMAAWGSRDRHADLADVARRAQLRDHRAPGGGYAAWCWRERTFEGRRSPDRGQVKRAADLSEGDAAGVLEGWPRPERVAPVDSVMQQYALKECHFSSAPIPVPAQRRAGSMVPILSESVGTVDHWN